VLRKTFPPKGQGACQRAERGIGGSGQEAKRTPEKEAGRARAARQRARVASCGRMPKSVREGLGMPARGGFFGRAGDFSLHLPKVDLLDIGATRARVRADDPPRVYAHSYPDLALAPGFRTRTRTWARARSRNWTRTWGNSTAAENHVVW
jgi:hypothetical protein